MTGGDYSQSNGNAGDKGIYRKHAWILVHRWRNNSVDEAFLKAEKMMTDDFDVAGRLAFQKWPQPNPKKIGPRPRKSVLFLLLTLCLLCSFALLHCKFCSLFILYRQVNDLKTAGSTTHDN